MVIAQAILTTWGFYAWHSHLLSMFGDVHAVWLLGNLSLLFASRFIRSLISLRRGNISINIVCKKLRQFAS